MKKMRHMKRKALVALVLSVTMLLTLMPGLVFGVSDAQSSPDTVSSSIDYPTVNFTDVAPFLPPVSGTAPRRSPARAAGDANTGSDNGNNGMAVNKTSVYNEDTGAYDITLEAYATGSKIIHTVTSDVPTDVVLVLDQSGSMEDDMGQLVYTAYSGNTRQNSDLYEKQDNLWYKLSDGSYVAVTVTSRNDSIQYAPITNGRNNEDYDWWSDSTYTNLWDNKDDLYAKINGEYQKVTVSRSGYGNNRTYTYTLPDGTQIASSRGDDAAPAISSTDDGYLYLASIDTTQTVYTYTYTDANGTVQTIGTSTGDSTNFTAATLYSRSTTDSGITRLEAWARDGLTDEQIAHNAGISRSTLAKWRTDHQDISDALKKGKEVVDYEVENALLLKALCGDVTAQIFWLKNRRPDKWRDKPAEPPGDIEDIGGIRREVFGDE